MGCSLRGNEQSNPGGAAGSICYVVNDLSFFLSHRLPLALEAIRCGYQVVVAAPPHRSSSGLAQHGIGFSPIPLDRFSASPVSALSTVFALRRIFRAQSFHVVHLITIKAVLLGSLAMWGLPLRVVWAVPGRGQVFTKKGLWFSLRRGVVKCFYRLAAQVAKPIVIFQNRADLLAFQDMGIASADRSVLIRGSGFDPGLLSIPNETSEEMVLMASRPLREKGVAEFVEIAQRVRAQRPSVHFVFAGELGSGNPGDLPLAELERLRALGAVEFAGFCSDMKPLFQRSAICCLPTSYGEGVPKFLIEAAASGRAIVCSDIPGCKEIVQDGVNGFTIPVSDLEGYVTTILRLIEDRPLRAEMGSRGRDIAVAEGFSAPEVATSTVKLYQSECSQK